MYEIFQNTYRGSNKSYPIFNLRTWRPIIQRELTRVSSHYRVNPVTVPVTHILVQLLNYLNISHTRNSTSTINAAIDRTPQASKVLGLVHPYNSRIVEHPSNFYNPHVREIVILDETSDVNISFVKRNWRRLNAIKILTHPFNDINLHLCNGHYPTYASGYAVFVVNVPLLVLIYKYWTQYQLSKGLDIINPKRFVGQLVIPNLLIPHMNIAFINRAMDTYNGVLTPVMRRVHPVSVIDITQQVDKVIESQAEILSKNLVDPYNLYTCFEGVLRENWLSSMQVPDIPANQNVRWAMEVSVLRYIHFLISYYSKRNPQYLDPIKNSIRYDIKRMRNNNEFKAVIQTTGGSMIAQINTILSI